jgi:hypothetical protein
LKEKIEASMHTYIKALPDFHIYGSVVKYESKASSWLVNENYFRIQTLQHKHLSELTGIEEFEKIYQHWKTCLQHDSANKAQDFS